MFVMFSALIKRF